jgi:hypothetical protein
MRCFIASTVVLGLTMGTFAQTTRPTTRPTEPPNPDLMLRQLLSPARPSAKPLEPVDFPQEKDQTSRMAVAPKVESQNLVREGSYIPERIGRLTRTADGQAELTFESDGSALKDPPMIILPNLKLTAMETAVKNSSRDLKFHISGVVTEYNGRNYILLEQVVVKQDDTVPASKKADERDNAPIRP